MTDTAGNLPWTEEQWSRARKVVQESARRARVASSFLPLFGPLPAEQVTVSAQVMTTPSSAGSAWEAPQRMEIDMGQMIPLTTIAADVYLRNSDLADPDMSSALAMIGRAADVLGRVEDSIIFNGQLGANEGPAIPDPVRPEIYTVRGGREAAGLLTHEGVERIPVDGPDYPSALVGATVKAIGELEGSGFHGPFALALGNELYLDANSPNQNSMVLASDRILPFLGGPLVRSSAIPAGEGVLVALAAEPVDLVVATDLELRYVQTTLEPRPVLRLRERFALRIKQHEALRVLSRSAGA